MHSPFFIVAVIFRTAAVAILLYGVLTFFTSLALGAGLAPSASALFIRLFVVYVLAAVLLWFIARPAAGMIVRGVE